MHLSTHLRLFDIYSLRAMHSQPNAFGAKVLVPTALLLSNWKILLSNYQDKMVIDFLSYGWPINYTAPTRPVSSLHNHPSASQFASHVQDYIDTESSWNAIAGPFVYPPFSDNLVCSPLQTVPKRGSSKRWVVMDLSFPHSSSVMASHRILTWASISLCGYPGLIGSSTSFSRKAVTVLFSRKMYAERIDNSLSIPRTTSSSAFLIRETFILTLVALSVYVPQP